MFFYSSSNLLMEEKALKSTCACYCSYLCPTNAEDSGVWASNLAEEAVPPPYDASSAEYIYRPEVMDTIEKTIVSLDDQLRDLNLKIHGR